MRPEETTFRSNFEALELPHRLRHESRGRLDLLPYSRELAPNDKLELSAELTFTVTGFDQIPAAAIEIALPDGRPVPVIPIPLYAVLKLVAFSDRVRWSSRSSGTRAPIKEYRASRASIAVTSADRTSSRSASGFRMFQ